MGRMIEEDRESINKENGSEDKVTKPDFSVYEGYLHAELGPDGKHGVLIDGPSRDKEKLIASIRDVWSSLPAVSEEGLNPRGEFVADMSSIFKLATQDIARPGIDSVVEELESVNLEAYSVDPQTSVIDQTEFTTMEGKFFKPDEEPGADSEGEEFSNEEGNDGLVD